MDAISRTRSLLSVVKGFTLSQNALSSEYGELITALEKKIDQPCVLAIAGKVKAGKSSFLNALLGQNLAKTGETETTATINIFKYGEPEDPLKPVKVVWDDGHVTFEPKNFMDSLQGHDEHTLNRAIGIKWLEFYLKHPILEEITLVDTPGTGALVGENDDAHQKVTELFFKLRKQHSKQTLECTGNADAVIYLVGSVPTMDGKTFLDDFLVANGGSSSSINSIGVMSKVDIDEKLLACRNEQAEYVAAGLRDQLNCVIPVSASVWQLLPEVKSHLHVMKNVIATIPDAAFDYFMSMDECYLETEQEVLDDLYVGSEKKPLLLEERKALRHNLPWSVFRTIATTLRSNDVETAVSLLENIAGIPKVKRVIKQHFFDRSKIIRCFSIASNLAKLLFDMRNRVIPKIASGGWNNESVKYMQKTCDDVKLQVESLMNNLIDIDKRFNMQRLLQREHAVMGDTDAYSELSVLFGLFEGNLPSDYAQRLSYWNRVYDCASDHSIRALAEYAVICYGKLSNKN